MKYFGFDYFDSTEIKRNFKQRNIVVIEDITHSFLQKKPATIYSDYVVGSFRKWTGLYSGGFAYKSRDSFIVKKPNKTNEYYVALRKKSMNLKQKYLNKEISDKSFLHIFGEAETLLEKDYKDYKMDDMSLEILKNMLFQDIKLKRRENSKYLIDELKKFDYLELIYGELAENDVPLFIPIQVKNGKRDALKKYLIHQNIYCPVHWTLSQDHIISDNAKKVYENVLSIICDQRYSKKDMIYIVNKLEEFDD